MRKVQGWSVAFLLTTLAGVAHAQSPVELFRDDFSRYPPGREAEEVLDLIMQMTDNAGATDEHRALNYLAMRYPALYTTVGDQFAKNASFAGIEGRPAPLRP